MRRSSSRTVIGGSNRRDHPTLPAAAQPPAPPVHSLERRASTVLDPRLNTTVVDVHSAELQPTLSAKSLKARAQKQRKVVPPRTEPTEALENPANGAAAAAAMRNPPEGLLSRSGSGGSSERLIETHDGKVMTPHQEYAMSVMTDFFSRRPLEQMRNAFRNADVDGSGELDVEEFQMAVRAMGTTLTDKDARTIFLLADEDGSGTLGIDEFFVNFRHDRFPRERFFWSKQCGGAANLSKTERKELAARVHVAQQPPARRSTGEIFKVLNTKVRQHGSAEKVFRILDTNKNGSLEVSELADAIRPYEITIDDAQAEELLRDINRIAGKAPLADLTYESFATVFNPTAGPKHMGGEAHQPPPPSELVARHVLPDDVDYPALGEVRSIDPNVLSATEGALLAAAFSSTGSLGRTRSAGSLGLSRGSLGSSASLGSRVSLGLSRSLEMHDSMRSLATLRPGPLLDHKAARAPTNDQEREAEFNNQQRHDQLGGWRGRDGTMAGCDGGNLMGKEIMKTGRGIDWNENIQAGKLDPKANGLLAANTRPPMPGDEPTDLERPAQVFFDGRGLGSTNDLGSHQAGIGAPGGGSGTPGKPRPSTAAAASPGTGTGTGGGGGGGGGGAEGQQQDLLGSRRSLGASHRSLGTLSFSDSNASLPRGSTRSSTRLVLYSEQSGSQSTLECLRPDMQPSPSHHNIEEAERFEHTSSIASIRTVSGAKMRKEVLGLNDSPGRRKKEVVKVDWIKDAAQIADKQRYREKVRTLGMRQRTRDSLFSDRLASRDNVDALKELARQRTKAEHTDRIAKQQLVHLTRACENGKAPVLLEAGPKPSSWVPVPPHLSSNWRSISGQLVDPPARDTVLGFFHTKANPGLRRVTDAERGFSAAGGPARPTLPMWGGTHQDGYHAIRPSTSPIFG